jgi:hypothetical protein
MPVQCPLTLDAPTPEQLTDERGDGTRLTATVEFLGRFHHLTLIRVTETPYDAKGNPLESTEDPAYDHSELIADDLEDQEDLVHLGNLYEAFFETTELDGFPGHYVAYMHPFDR